MFFGFDLKEIFMFPLKDEESRKHLLVGGLVALAGFFLPIVPYLLMLGYAAQIARQGLRGDAPRMIAWEDWGALLKEGAKLLGIRLIFSLPLLMVTLPLMLAGFALPFAAETMNSTDADALVAVFGLVMMGSFCFILPVSLILAILLPVAEMHVIEQGDFAAGFLFKEWWAILRANLGGFIAAFGITYLASMILMILVQILAATLIFACLLIVLLPAITIYLTLIMYMVSAAAYRNGKMKLTQPA